MKTGVIKQPCAAVMRRRHFLGAVAAACVARGRAAWGVGTSRVRPHMPGWPSPAEWAALRSKLGGRLAPVTIPKLARAAADRLLTDPFYLSDQPGLTQVSGWVDAWQSSPSAYVVQAASAADVAAAVRFAAAHRLRLVVKGGGHSYLGGSNAPDSLLVWTKAMDAITLHDGFVPQGTGAAPVPAVSVGAGCLWLHAYDAVTTRAGRYVQGGGCTSVGVAGLVQGGGFGSCSKQFGLAAASLLEAEIVTADGATRVVNAAREPDLFWALKGGGGGTFGVVTRLTLRTHDLPHMFGAVSWTIQAQSDAAYHALLARFIAFYADRLFNRHWGEQARARPDNRLVISMVFQGLDEAAAQAVWQDFVDFVRARPQDYSNHEPLRILAFPARYMWDEAALSKFAPDAISVDPQPGAKPRDYWWKGDGEQAGAIWYGYDSAWMPATLLRQDQQARLVDAWFAGSRHWGVAFHFNKGLAGAADAAIGASRDTAMNPDVLGAFALVIIAGDGPPAFAGQPAPDMQEARAEAAGIQAAMNAMRAVAPGTGSYLSECDYFTPGWQQASWGTHWARLQAVKRQYDPDGLFVVHHGVGSEVWSADGFTRLA